MQTITPFLQYLRQNRQLPVRIVSPEFGHLTAEEAATYVAPHRSPYYFFMFMLEGRSCHQIDLHKYEVNDNELIFVTPQQIHEQEGMSKGGKFVKLGFDEICLSLLPGQYEFLVHSLNDQKVGFSPSAALRVKAIFAILLDLLRHWDTAPELILAHLNSLLTEINAAYLPAATIPAKDTLSRYSDFRAFVEKHLTEQPGVGLIAEKLGINPNGLYKLVKQHAGLSPKEYITKRLILEAGRRLYHMKDVSIKELAFELGFNDPEYFSRLFKKVTGHTIPQFLADLSGN
ncbi:AraC family transcriptional regulator [Chitinophaga filiformis]|uniref:Helix-turn-helix domain-containing protein n=1 Tax=Chitinophaga filiformis TaxID=104663 RepID=A0ABY4HSA7_CHIFI|nr:helix-turn-helix domain-containing protein [Chitinophaga filiformis]UPK66633.1 helix-turn-helix domain-containing protein [Chitinophaga filiformis]